MLHSRRQFTRVTANPGVILWQECYRKGSHSGFDLNPADDPMDDDVLRYELLRSQYELPVLIFQKVMKWRSVMGIRAHVLPISNERDISSRDVAPSLIRGASATSCLFLTESSHEWREKKKAR
ncbi:hypothetical protein CEXT_614411 [Caerostris extrusa]|uniref:Uncharacterized protein n=1 Tax=Caerostris extrusa TaxID=172846 RepID=A0AAV4RU34_CAEEX|nr:hypothetical protein CEXT_614411 [Caerostris extrusa]